MTIASSKKEAQEAGAKFYYGRPCLWGHTSKRYTSNSECFECRSAFKGVTSAAKLQLVFDRIKAEQASDEG